MLARGPSRAFSAKDVAGPRYRITPAVTCRRAPPGCRSVDMHAGRE